MSVVIFGSINMDLTTYVPRLPDVGETLFGHSFITVPGGKGCNQAVAAARLGADAHFFGRIGADVFGPEVLTLVGEEGVDVGGVAIDEEHDTGLAVISVDDNADNTIIVISGANFALDESDVARCKALLGGAQVLMLQLEVPLEAVLSAARAAHEQGVTVILDPAPARDLPDEAYHLADVMTPNEVETEMLVGIRPTNAGEAAQAATMLQERGVRTAIIKLGVKGVYYQEQQESGFVPAFSVDAVDTVAAGDAFNGGLAVALSEGRPVAEAVRWGAAAGALAATRPGAMPSMPHRADLEALLKETPPS